MQQITQMEQLFQQSPTLATNRDELMKRVSRMYNLNLSIENQNPLIQKQMEDMKAQMEAMVAPQGQEQPA